MERGVGGEGGARERGGRTRRGERRVEDGACRRVGN